MAAEYHGRPRTWRVLLRGATAAATIQADEISSEIDGKGEIQSVTFRLNNNRVGYFAGNIVAWWIEG